MRTSIDYTDFKALRCIALEYARAHGIYDEQIAEDFAQEYLLAIWLGKTKSLKFQLINFLRIYYGRTDIFARPGSKAKSYALRTMKSYSDTRILKRGRFEED